MEKSDIPSRALRRAGGGDIPLCHVLPNWQASSLDFHALSVALFFRQKLAQVPVFLPMALDIYSTDK